MGISTLASAVDKFLQHRVVDLFWPILGQYSFRMTSRRYPSSLHYNMNYNVDTSHPNLQIAPLPPRQNLSIILHSHLFCFHFHLLLLDQNQDIIINSRRQWQICPPSYSVQPLRTTPKNILTGFGDATNSTKKAPTLCTAEAAHTTEINKGLTHFTPARKPGCPTKK